MKKLIIMAATMFCLTGYAQTNTAVSTGITSNTNVQQAIAGILMGAKNVGGDIYSAGKDVVSAGISMVKTEMPELVKEFLKWKFFETSFYSIIGFILIITAIIIPFKARKYYQNAKTVDMEAASIALGIFGTLICAVVGNIIFFTHIVDAIQIYVAPRIYLIEYVMDVIKKHN